MAVKSAKDIFYKAAAEKAGDLKHRIKINYNIKKYDNALEEGLQQYANLQTAQQRAKIKKWECIENLDHYLQLFEKNFTANGGVVLWAETAEEANQHVLNIANKHKANAVVKAKSMATEEIELNPFLEKQGIVVNETDLGEYIVQLAGEKPYHIVTPAMHKSKEDVQKLFHEKLGTAPDLNPQQLTHVARENLRERYITADIGISGANFLIADTGSIALTENEGNARLSTAFPEVHVTIAGIEKLIPSLHDLHIFWPLLATYGTGQNVTVYNSIISGPRNAHEETGPTAMYVILLDNGRTNLLAKTKQREALQCIRCGACLNACPVYKNIGGHSYGTTYSGPIGSVITPHLKNLNEMGHLSDASSICGKCTETCPVQIDLHNLLLYNRNDVANEIKRSVKDKLTWYVWRKAMLSRSLMNRGKGIKNLLMRMFFKDAWGSQKALQEVQKSFNLQWRGGKDK